MNSEQSHRCDGRLCDVMCEFLERVKPDAYVPDLSHKDVGDTFVLVRGERATFSDPDDNSQRPATAGNQRAVPAPGLAARTSRRGPSSCRLAHWARPVTGTLRSRDACWTVCQWLRSGYSIRGRGSVNRRIVQVASAKARLEMI